MANFLLVDDNADFRLMLQLKFSSLGHKVFVAGDGVRGLQIVMDNMLDIILLDMSMPHRGGLETLRLIRSIQPKVKVFIVTALIEEDARKEAHKLEVADILLKPVSIKDLLSKIEQTLAPTPS